MGDQHQYGHPLLRHLVAAGASNLPIYSQQTEPSFYFSQRNLAPLQNHPHHYDFTPTTSHHQLIFPSSTNSGFYNCTNNATTSNNNNNSVNISNMVFPSSGANTSTTTSSSCGGGGGAAFFGMEMESNSSRWPRQETLTLLDIRSRLDSRFKEANQKGPLWDEVSRIMLEEHGYQRSGKKCREKFENLYKYYKKTKEGKAGRQDGKHYRFFRQLEALYGDSSNNQATNSVSEIHFINNPLLFQTPVRSTAAVNQESLVQEHKHTSDHSLSFSNTSEFETSSSENNDDGLSAIASMMNRSTEKQKGRLNNETQSNGRVKKSWKSKVKDFVDSQMNKLLETQEAWMERMLKTIEDREQERTNREVEWKKQEATRFEQEHEFWARERAWIEARDATLMEELNKYSRRKGELSSIVDQFALDTQCHRRNKGRNRWSETEILSLIQLKTTTEQRTQENGYSKQGMWEEIAAKMTGLGHERSVEECREKWDKISVYFSMNSGGTVEDRNKTNVNSTSYHSYVASDEVQGSSFNQFPENEEEQFMWINKHGLKLGNEADHLELIN